MVVIIHKYPRRFLSRAVLSSSAALIISRPSLILLYCDCASLLISVNSSLLGNLSIVFMRLIIADALTEATLNKIDVSKKYTFTNFDKVSLSSQIQAIHKDPSLLKGSSNTYSIKSE